VRTSLDVLADAIGALRFKRDRMRAALGAGYVTATEVADWLAARGCPSATPTRSPGGSWPRALDPEVAVERRDLPGGPARRRVEAALLGARARIEARRAR
jgi:argininosuccinate lyase